MTSRDLQRLWKPWSNDCQNQFRSYRAARNSVCQTWRALPHPIRSSIEYPQSHATAPSFCPDCPRHPVSPPEFRAHSRHITPRQRYRISNPSERLIPRYARHPFGAPSASVVAVDEVHPCISPFGRSASKSASCRFVALLGANSRPPGSKTGIQMNEFNQLRAKISETHPLKHA